MTAPKNGNDTSAAAQHKNSSSTSLLFFVQAILGVAFAQILYRICLEAYAIRLYAINEFGRVIHEFDPYFNYRATIYLYEHGWQAFSHWFDYMVWYPLGRPVGTTIYPGMQVTAVWIKNHLLPEMSLNDICCFMPAWFGVTATLAVAWMTFEATRGPTFGCMLSDLPIVSSLYAVLIQPLIKAILNFLARLVGSQTALGVWIRNDDNSTTSIWTAVASAVAAAAIMSVVPAHLLRSIGGGYDNEAIAMTAMVLTFAVWMTALRQDHGRSLWVVSLWGCATGLAYFYMVAAWGGYVFCINLIGVHAAVLVACGRYSPKLHRAYTCFYIMGTALACQVPVVGWTPLKSLEQMGPLLAFGGLQLIELCRVMERNLTSQTAKWKLRIQVFGVAAMLAGLVAWFLASQGYFGPISSRVRGLFVEHTKTGNPLVDSVAEHQAASSQAYFQYLHHTVYLLVPGLIQVVLAGWNDSSSFLAVYAGAAYYFSHRMVRLILLTAPIASSLAGIAVGRLVGWGILNAILWWDTNVEEKVQEPKTKKTKKPSKTNGNAESSQPRVLRNQNKSISLLLRVARVLGTLAAINWAIPHAKDFYNMCHEMAQAISHPTIIQKARTRSGEVVMVDDYREAYVWLSENTPEDARVLAWWDYGYQITGIGNRTTLADGNTWNHEHIALLGRILTGPEKEAHRIARHLADYVLIWAGGGGDDLAKSPHLRRIANSVYRGLCREPVCRDFGFTSDRTPTESMEQSLLFTLHGHNIVPGVEADPNRFREVFSSKYGKVRIFKINSVSKESKRWVEEHRVCDAPGSWYCPGHYPPALEKILREKRDFAQLEDFNRGSADEEYTKEYFENLQKRDSPRGDPPAEKQRAKLKKLGDSSIENINENWEDNEITTTAWELISQNRISELRDMIADNPSTPHIRSKDGRGPMWWAHEYGNTKVIELLKRLGVTETRKDANGLTPLDISKAS